MASTPMPTMKTSMTPRPPAQWLSRSAISGVNALPSSAPSTASMTLRSGSEKASGAPNRAASVEAVNAPSIQASGKWR